MIEHNKVTDASVTAEDVIFAMLRIRREGMGSIAAGLLQREPVLGELIVGRWTKVQAILQQLGLTEEQSRPVLIEVCRLIVEPLMAVERSHRIVTLLVGRMEVDLTTKETEIDLHVPDWLAASLSRQPTMGLDAVLACKPFNETQHAEGAEIAVYRCQQTAKRPVCFYCHRLRRAA